MNVAIVFDNTLRPETTGTYCLRALEGLKRTGRIEHVKHVLPSEVSRLHGVDVTWNLIIAVDDGLPYDLPRDLAPIAWWAIDTHVDFDRTLRKAQQAEWTFAAQRNGATRLRQHGVDAVWLPLACDPEMHGRQSKEQRFDWCFVGNIFPGERSRLLQGLKQRFSRSCVGNHYFEEMAAVYSSSKVIFNRSLADDINMRVFEAICSGSLLITNELSENGLSELFQDGTHLVTYQSDEELFDKLDFYLSHDDIRERIATTGRDEVLANHTYSTRMCRLLDLIEESHVTQHGNHDSSWLDQIDFGIKTFLRPQALKRLLLSIDEHYASASVTIVDDGGLDEAADEDSRFCRELISSHSRWRLVSLPFDSGVSPGRNTLVKQTDRPFLLLLDDDFCITSETRIERLWEHLTSDSTLGVAAGICVDCLGSRRERRKSGGLLERQGATLIHRTSAGSGGNPLQCDYFPHFALFRREVFSNVRWRGEVGAEHFDFCLQLQADGISVVQDETVIVDHYPTTPALEGYAARRFDYATAQQEFLQRWGLKDVVQDGVSIMKQHERGAAVSWSPKSQAYFEFDRPDVQELVPLNARRILDIGCGAGRLGEALKARQSAHLTGIEVNPIAAERARSRLDKVVELNLEADEVEFAHGQFDCVICADILEHMRYPELLLKKIRHWLTPDGALIVSVPNVQNHTVVQSLLSGNWTYESAGLLDADHVRFFTRRELEKLLFRTGFDVREWRMVPGEGFDMWQEQGQPLEISVGALQMSVRSAADAADFFAYQFLVHSTPQLAPASPSRHSMTGPYGLTSIVIVTWNQLPYTQMCLDSLRLRTDEPYELIVVDNGSTDGTVEWLRTQPDIRLIDNAANRGFPAAANQGLQVARGENLLLLNNDTVLTTGWLRRMLDVLHRESDCGLVGPTSNHVGSNQEVPVTYTDLANLDGFAWDRKRALLERAEPLIAETDRLIGFCLLFKRAVPDTIGLLDERFGIGCFEDDDFCRRARRAGFRALIARDAFIHHFGSVTFQASGADLGSVLQKNQQLFEQKWTSQDTAEKSNHQSEMQSVRSIGPHRSDDAHRESLRSSGKPRPLFVLEQDDEGNLLIVPNDIRLSACLIVRDNATTIRPCLESLKPWVDELIVVDTGSTDTTPDVAVDLGARVFSWDWQDDFAAARNISLDQARGEWIFWMDSDDILPEESGRKLRALADGEHPENIFGYVMQVHCPGTDPHDLTIVDHVKLIRNQPGLRFEFRIHEQVLPAIRRAGGDVAFTDVHVVHAGYDRSAEGQTKKLDRDFHLLHLELCDRPDHPFVLFNLGMTHADCGQHQEAIRYLKRCLEVSDPEESHVRKAYALLVGSLSQCQRFADAQRVCEEGRGVYPNDQELLFRQALLEQHHGRFQEAVGTYQELLKSRDERYFSSMDRGLVGFKARQNLAIVLEEIGDFTGALAEWHHITEENPDYGPGWRGLIDLLIECGRSDDVAQVCTQLSHTSNDSLRAIGAYGEARRFECCGDLKQALNLYATADLINPDETTSLQRTCRIHFEAGEWPEAQESLQELQGRDPGDASVLHNLGIAQWQLGQREEAIAALRESLKLRPGSADTWRQLGTRLMECGQKIEAGECWQQAERLAANELRSEASLMTL